VAIAESKIEFQQPANFKFEAPAALARSARPCHIHTCGTAARRDDACPVSSNDLLVSTMGWTMLSAMTLADKQHAAGAADLGGVPHAPRHDRCGTTVERHFLEPGRLLKQQDGRAGEQVDELLALGMHLPVRPVRGALELRDEPAMAKPIEFGLRHGPKLFATRHLLRRAVGGEVNVGVARVEEQGSLRSAGFDVALLKRLDVDKDFLPTQTWLNEAEAAFVVPGLDDAFEAHEVLPDA